MERDILNIYCPNCGAPAKFDVERQVYACGYCDGKVTIEGARSSTHDLRYRRGRRLKEQARDFPLMTSSCTGCGATLVFEQDEAVSSCEFCGRSLARKKYVYNEKLPQSVIPFGVTLDEAKEKLRAWCDANKFKREARHLRSRIDDLKGYYLPYEMVRGPVHLQVCKSGDSTKYDAEGFLNDEFINCSSQLDNLVLDAMEPYDLDDLQPFEFAYVAGLRVKIADIDEKTADIRLRREVRENYTLACEKIWGTKTIDVTTAVEPTTRLPVLLPVYYITGGVTRAAVNGQTGKVSVRAEKNSYYLSLPWWLKTLLLLILACGITFLATWAGGFEMVEAAFITGALGFFYLIVYLCMFADSSADSGGFGSYRKMFSSGELAYRRVGGELVPREDILKRKIAEPVFFRKLDGRRQAVTYAFRTPGRMITMAVHSLLTLFFPVIAALVVNGFNFRQLDLRGSAVWFTITVPLVPILFARFGIQFLYDEPQIFTFNEKGEKVRVGQKKIQFTWATFWAVVRGILGALLVPPICFITWFILASLCVMIYLTAFGM